MSRNGKVIVAMSGGVDSSVAAYLLREQGYECVGVFMRVGAHAAEAEQVCSLPGEAAPNAEHGRATPVGQPTRRLKHGCCSAADALDARAIAGRLGVPFYALNFERGFDRVIDYFVDEYARGRTPNPCVMCNTRLKFGKLLRYADMMDAEFVATGHYAHLLWRDGRACLARSLNREKDQSSVLFGIRREELARCLFPLGEISDKAQVRRIAAELGLRVHDKPDSQEICFVPNNDYKQVVRERRPETLRPGEVRDSAGNLLGTHQGVASFTIGQRRGLGIAAGEPVYVTRLDVVSNTVTVGPREELLSGGLIAERVNWLVEPLASGTSRRAEIKIRYMHTPAPGPIRVVDGGDVEARFDDPQPAVTPGQAAVFYDAGGVVLGGGWIGEAKT
jgi:tRNA-specific 2-thiouridylase